MCSDRCTQEFPFDLINNIPMRFNQRKMQWENIIGTKDNIGYYIISWKSGEKKRNFDKVHRVVWKIYNGNIPENFEIDHIDGDKSNNNIENLRLVSHKDNINFAIDRLGKWGGDGKLLPHQKQLCIIMPSNANWKFWADRWDVHKNTLLNIRAKNKKK